MKRFVSAGIDPTCVEDASLDGIERVVVVVPHPDDEALACGLLLAQAARRDLDIRVVAVTDGDAAYPGHDAEELAACRRLEQTAALSALGVPADRIVRIGLPDGRVGDHIDHLASVIAPHLRCGRSTLLVAPTIHDWHPDHEACGHAARIAFGHHRHRSEVTYWSSMFWAHHHPGSLVASRPHLIRLGGTPGDAVARCRAVRSHHSQFEPPHGAEPILDGSLISHLDENVELYVSEHT